MNLGPRRIKFIWGAGKVIQARWHFGLFGSYEHVKGYDGSGLVFSLRGLLILGLFLAGTAYVGSATAYYLWLDRGTHNYVTYTDVLLWPLRRQAIREKRGRAYIDEGIDDLRTQRWGEAEMKLRVGLLREPGALRARLALAEFYVLSQRRPLALQVLAEGVVQPGYPGRRYLDTYFGLALQGEDYARVRSAADRCLAEPDLPAKERNWLRQQKFAVELAEGRAAEVLAELGSKPALDGGDELRVLALLGLGRAADAAALLEQWRATAGPTAQILRLQVRACRELGQLDRMEAVLAEFRRQLPTDPGPYAYGVVQRAMSGRRTPAETGLDDYFLRFGANADSMMPLAQPLAEIGAVELLQDFIRRLAEQGHDQRVALLQLAQAQLRTGAWAAAAANVAKVRALGPVREERPPAGLELMELLTQVAMDPAEGLQVKLLELLGRQFLPVRSQRLIIETLLRAGRPAAALEVATRAERQYAGNTALQTLKADAQAAVQAAEASKPRVVAANAGERDSILVEELFFTQLEAAMAAQRWTDALAAIRAVQVAKPGWLDRRQADVLVRQMRIAHAMHESLDLVLAARLLLDGSVPRAKLVMDYAAELKAQGATPEAVLLLKEVVRNLPNHATARRLLQEWQPKPKAP